MLEAALQRHRPDTMPQWHHQALSQREQDILRWLAEGLRISDIALNRLGVSEATINKDLRRLKDRLNIRTLEELTEATQGVAVSFSAESNWLCSSAMYTQGSECPPPTLR